MMATDIAQILVDAGAVEIRVDPQRWFTWASGKRSPIYCDNRLLLSIPEARRRVADALAKSVSSLFPEVEVIAGTATAGIPHAAWVAERLDLPMVYVRSSAKEHGKQRRVEGRPLAGERVVLIEDLISFGGSSLSCVEALREEGGAVLGVQAIFTYGFPQAIARFEDAGIRWSALTSYAELVERLDLDEATRRTLLAWRES